MLKQSPAFGCCKPDEHEFLLCEPKEHQFIDIIKSNVLKGSTRFMPEPSRPENNLKSFDTELLNIMNRAKTMQDSTETSVMIEEKIKEFKEIASFSTMKHNEVYEVENKCRIDNWEVLVKLLEKSDVVNYSFATENRNEQLSLQGFGLHNFMNFGLLKYMRFRDMIDANSIEFDTPYTRTNIRR
jgi:hypothetical protein